LARQNSSFVDGNQAPRSKLRKTVLGRTISMAHKTYSVPTLCKCSAADSFRESKAANRTRSSGNVRPFPGGQYCLLLISPGAEDLWSVETVTSSISVIPQKIPRHFPDSGANSEGRQCSKKQFSDVEDACALAQAMVDTVREPLIVLDKDLRVIAASRSFYVKFATNPDESQGKHLYELGNGEWDIPRLRALLENIIPDHGRMDDYEVEHDFPHVGKRVLLLNACIVVYEKAHKNILLSIEDLTVQRALERDKDELLRQKDVLLDEIEHEPPTVSRRDAICMTRTTGSYGLLPCSAIFTLRQVLGRWKCYPICLRFVERSRIQ
jgi:hypothetical protein